MRRRIAAIATAAALTLGLAGALTPSNAAVLCPPGCAVAGLAKTVGGSDPLRVTMFGTITIVASTRTGEIADAVSVGQTYHLYVDGPVTTGAGGTLSGTALFHASSYGPGGYNSFGGYVSVSGTRDAIRFSSSNLEATLVSAAGSYQGPVVSYG